MRRLALLGMLLGLVSLVAAGSAQAFVVNDNGTVAGAALIPGTRAVALPAGVSRVTSSAPCSDPWLTSDLRLGSNGLCWHSGGSVMHNNETFALTWDRPTPHRAYWETTRQYEQQFLRDVSDGSGTFSSPYAVTPQYSDPGGHAQYASTYGGGCSDLGTAGGFTCQFGNGTGSGNGNDYPSPGCPVSGTDALHLFNDGSVGPYPNSSFGTCLTDAQIKAEVSAASGQLNGHIKPGSSPLVVVLTPPGVVDCLDSAGKFCSANSSAPARFCSYHSEANGLPYVVVPWAPLTACDEPNAHKIDLAQLPTVDKLAQYVGERLVSSLSEAHIAAIVNPVLNGWYSLDGSEINDNGWQDTGDPNFGCQPLGNEVDHVTVGNSSQNPYHLQREYNNAAAIESDPNAPGCALGNIFNPAFVIPSAVRPGDVVEFDGSATASTLIVPKGSYRWDFGDGTTAIGPSVVHTYARGGDYNVTLTVTDRGGNTRRLSQTISVLGKNGQPVGGSHGPGGWQAHIALVPQGLKKLLRVGVALRVRSNRRADGIATLMIPRAAARRAHIRTGNKPFVVIGRGTVARVGSGVKLLHIKIPRQMVSKLRRLHHVNLSIRLSLVSAGREHLALAVAGRY
jgi:PKD repeat protein